MPCAPLINKKDLMDAAKMLKSNKAITTVAENSIPIEWNYKLKNNILEPIFPGKILKNSISFSKSYREVGLFAGWKTRYFKKNIKFKKFKFSPFVLDYFKSIDIDYKKDWDTTKRIYMKNLHK
jgi:CMP-N-acetylneuraminic acid synthetase